VSGGGLRLRRRNGPDPSIEGESAATPRTTAAPTGRAGAVAGACPTFDQQRSETFAKPVVPILREGFRTGMQAIVRPAAKGTKGVSLTATLRLGRTGWKAYGGPSLATNRAQGRWGAVAPEGSTIKAVQKPGGGGGPPPFFRVAAVPASELNTAVRLRLVCRNWARSLCGLLSAGMW